MPVSQSQRIIDLVLAGHPAGDIAHLLGVTEAAVVTATSDLTTGPGQFGNAGILSGGAATVTAFAGGGQASATPLTASLNRVNVSTAVAPPYDSVKLPAATAGNYVFVVNTTSNPIQVFGSGTDTINGAASGTGVSQAPSSVEVFACPAAGTWFADLGAGFSGSLLTEFTQDNITAFAGGGQASATQLLAQTSRITTVATAGDSVKLPPSAPGLEVMLINHGANSMQVYGSGTDTIDDVATATGVSQMINSLVIYICTGAGKWYSNGIGTGFAGQFPTQSFENGITAFATGGQASARQLNNVINRVTTVATAGDSVRLPSCQPGMSVTVANASANALAIFPATGDAINGGAANAALAPNLPANKTATFTSAVAGQWHAVVGA